MNRALVAGSALTLAVGGALYMHGFAIASKALSLVGVGLIMLGAILFAKPLLDWCETWDRLTQYEEQAIDTDSEDESNDLEDVVVF